MTSNKNEQRCIRSENSRDGSHELAGLAYQSQSRPEVLHLSQLRRGALANVSTWLGARRPRLPPQRAVWANTARSIYAKVSKDMARVRGPLDDGGNLGLV